MSDPLGVLIGAGGVLLGALVAGGFSLLVPHVQTRRDHARWLREARLVAYSDYLSAIDLWMESATTRWLEAQHAPSAGDAPSESRRSQLEDEVCRAQSRLVLLGPDPVRIVTAGYHHAVLDRIDETQSSESLQEATEVDLEQLRRARGLMVGVMNRAWTSHRSERTQRQTVLTHVAM